MVRMVRNVLVGSSQSLAYVRASASPDRRTVVDQAHQNSQTELGEAGVAFVLSATA